MGNQRGSTRLGCLITIFVLLLVGGVGYKVGPVYLDKIAFEDELAAIVNKAGAAAWGDKTIVEHVVSSARSNNFQVDRRSIKIEKASRFQTASRLVVTVQLNRTVGIPGYAYTFHFTSQATGLLGRL